MLGLGANPRRSSPSVGALTCRGRPENGRSSRAEDGGQKRSPLALPCAWSLLDPCLRRKQASFSPVKRLRKNSKKLVGYKTRTLTCGLKNRTARGEGRTASYKSSTPPPRHTKETTKNLNYIRGRKTGHVRLRHFETGVCFSQETPAARREATSHSIYLRGTSWRGIRYKYIYIYYVIHIY